MSKSVSALSRLQSPFPHEAFLRFLLLFPVDVDMYDMKAFFTFLFDFHSVDFVSDICIIAHYSAIVSYSHMTPLLFVYNFFPCIITPSVLDLFRRIARRKRGLIIFIVCVVWHDRSFLFFLKYKSVLDGRLWRTANGTHMSQIEGR